MRSWITALIVLTLPAAAQQHDPSMHRQHEAGAQHDAPVADRRQAVHFPQAMREHTLANLRDHLFALQEIQSALSREAYDQAADIAESRLGMSSLGLHGAHEVAKFMPQGMQDAGTAMHRSASRFAVATRDAGATGDVRPALAALSDVMGACVACHAGYRLE
jgi:hypothetical protein